MTLFSLYRTHAALCSQMATSAINREIKTRWDELAKYWDQKAKEGEQAMDASAETVPARWLPAVSLPQIPDDDVFTVVSTSASPQPAAVAIDKPVPTIVSPPLSGPSHTAVKAPIDNSNTDPVIENDDDWNSLLADIRRKTHSVD